MAVWHRSHCSFLRHLKTLETAKTDPGGLATSLFQKDLIDKPSTAVLERSRELLQKVEVEIEAAFLSILGGGPTCIYIGRNL